MDALAVNPLSPESLTRYVVARRAGRQEDLRTGAGSRRPVLTGDEARATAQLLGLLNEAHPDGPVGELTGDVSERIVTRLRDSSAA